MASANVAIYAVGNFDNRFPKPKHEKIQLEKAVRVPMRDGTRLSTDLYFPYGAKGPLPVIALRTPYNKRTYYTNSEEGSIAHFFAGHGYVVAIQDMRGRYESEGDYTYFSENVEGEDGYDFVEWLANQPWSNGKIGTYGCSYLGENQIVLAAERHPNHLAAIPQAAGGGYGGTQRPIMASDGGVPELATIVSWMLAEGDQIFARPQSSLSDREFNLLAERFHTKLDRPEVDLEEAFQHLPILEILQNVDHRIPTEYERYVSHVPEDAHYKKLSYVTDDDRFDVPALHINSWYDGAVNETLHLFNLFQRNADTSRGQDHQYVIISPTNHCESEYQEEQTPVIVGERNMGNAQLRFFRFYLDWFDYWLKGEENGVLNTPRVQYYLMGANEWRSSERWPLPGTKFTKYYLHSEGEANSRKSDGRLRLEEPKAMEPPDEFIYDPRNPVPSVGGPICCTTDEAAPSGPYDQSTVELRDDVLVYTSESLEEGIEVTGPLQAVLYVSSSAADTDFTVKLVDVYPDGRAYNLQEAILRARYRNGFPQAEMMQEGRVYKLNISLHATANYFGPGHRIRLEVSSSNFPRFARNLNTGKASHLEVEPVIAKNAIHHSPKYPSHVVLPIIRTK